MGGGILSEKSCFQEPFMSNNQQNIVNTKAGALEGIFKNGLYVFKGIPYAAPPTGILRWMPPRPVKPWSDVRPAKDYGPIAPQNLMPMELVGAPSFEGQPQSEDCLSLNIWTPGLDDALRPVFFWIHGGAFIIGAGTESFLEDGALARRGDIVVIDNVGFHKVPGIREAIESRGASLRYLPKYSPDLNPIEMSFSKFKALMRKASARTTSGIKRAVRAFLPSLSATECANYFRHAGYAVI